MIVQGRVEEEIDRHPTFARCDVKIGQCTVEVVRAIYVSWITDIIVIFRRTSQRKGIMTPTGVSNHLDKW